MYISLPGQGYLVVHSVKRTKCTGTVLYKTMFRRHFQDQSDYAGVQMTQHHR